MEAQVKNTKGKAALEAQLQCRDMLDIRANGKGATNCHRVLFPSNLCLARAIWTTRNGPGIVVREILNSEN